MSYKHHGTFWTDRSLCLSDLWTKQPSLISSPWGPGSVSLWIKLSWWTDWLQCMVSTDRTTPGQEENSWFTSWLQYAWHQLIHFPRGGAAVFRIDLNLPIGNQRRTKKHLIYELVVAVFAWHQLIKSHRTITADSRIDWNLPLGIGQSTQKKLIYDLVAVCMASVDQFTEDKISSLADWLKLASGYSTQDKKFADKRAGWSLNYISWSIPRG